MNHNVGYKRLNQNELNLLPPLFQEVYGKHKPVEYWEWKYYNNSVGEHSMYVVYNSDTDSIGGLIGGIPVKMKSHDRVVYSGQTCDIVIHPDYRSGRSYFKLDRLSTEESERRNCSFIFGFSNEITYPLSIKLLGFKEVCPISRMLKVVNPAPALMKIVRVQSISEMIGGLYEKMIKSAWNFQRKNFMKKSNEQNLSVVPIRRFDNRFDTLWREASREYEIVVHRDSEYLNWRYSDHPEKDYKIFALVDQEEFMGYVVLDIADEKVRKGRILDIFVSSDRIEYVSFLVMKAEEYFLENHVHLIVCWMFDHHGIYSVLVNRGYRSQKTDHCLIVKPIKETDHEYLTEKRNWYITMGDTDFF